MGRFALEVAAPQREKKMLKRLGLLCLLLALAACASAPPAAPAANLATECVETYDAAVDYFPDKVAVDDAVGFSVQYANHYKVVTLPTPFAGGAPVQYLLVQCGTPAPLEQFPDATLVEVPVQRFAALSTTYLPPLIEFGLLDRLVAIDTGQYVNAPEVQALLVDGGLAEIGSGSAVNVEQALALEPDLVMTYASGTADFDAHPRLQAAGLPVALNAEFLETSPLGRAEWAKFIALFFNAEAQANQWYVETAIRYDDLTALAQSVTARPTVITQTPYEGVWYLPGGDSFAAQLLADAGADYLWADETGSGSLPLDVESVFERAVAVDYWLDTGYYGTRDALLAADDRFGALAAFESGNVYNNDARVNANGGFDYYESGPFRPDDVLADLIAIFHPELLPDHEFVYYRRID